MQSKIVLISDDSDFFEYIIPKLKLRNSDELFSFKFSELPDKIHLLKSSLLIINSERNQEQTLELLEIANDVPVIVFGYNDDDNFKIEAYKKGMYGYFTLSSSDEEIEAKLIPALRMVSSFEKIALYREILVKNNLITGNNEVFLDFTNMLEREISEIKKNSSVATLLAIAPDEKSKYLIQPNKLETVILNKVRKNDILMNYSHNKYFLLLKNANLEKSKTIWEKIKTALPEGVYAGFSPIRSNKSRQQIVSEVLNSLHTSMSADSSFIKSDDKSVNNNFKFFRQEFNKKITQIVSPVFYHIQQTYNNKLFGMKIEQGLGDGYGVLYIKSDACNAVFRISSPGFSTINIDISYEKNDDIINENEHVFNLEPKRITIEPEDLEPGLLQDLIEEFIREFKAETENSDA